MKFADTVKVAIQGVYATSPYFWADSYLKRKEQACSEASEQQKLWRTKRLLLSERYIVYWLFAAMAIFLLTPILPWWCAIPLLLRVLGILNKELGVILFGTCKITEGTMVAASGRVIVLGLVNYLTAMFLMASVYALIGSLEKIPDYAQLSLPIWSLIQAMNIQFTLTSAFPPADLKTWFICLFHSGFCFLFGTIVISMFVSLLNIKPLQK
ncbi:hypothetical protein [Neptuniibacter caesariensis]|uniref:Uncharacterized protein n=1 Tax=Neptuniibacter caesariensis TaxID=207954 RepID=A0A7U8C3S2_NEPCE|nr:hypothetical protein [Neptuniibacter caesariensis]EAR59570.1 hypothetical protein MED92_11654 [Oceanospirillum sp. MED92] [Neptuniibacter caesariensis]